MTGPDDSTPVDVPPRHTATTRQSVLATLALLAMTACWGSTFFLIKDLLDRVPVLDFLAVRFAIATVGLFLLAPRALGRLSAASRRHAVVLGLLYGVAQILQTAGLAHTPASVSGFITGMYVVCTPLLAALILRTRITAMTWGAVLLATAGLAVLTLNGFSVGYGEAVTLVAAVLYALHIVGLGAWAGARQAMGMTIVQLFVITVVCFAATAPDGLVLPSTPSGLALGGLHGAVRGGARAGRADLGAGAPAADPHRDHHEHGAGVRGVLRGAARRGVGDRADGGRRADGADRDAGRGARAAAQDRGRGPAHRGLTGCAPALPLLRTAPPDLAKCGRVVGGRRYGQVWPTSSTQT